LAVKDLNEEGGINGKRIELVIKDDQLDEKETITQYKQLVNVEGVHYILAAAYGGLIALGKQPENDGIILIGSLDASEELANLSKNTFAIGVYDESIGYKIADYLNENNIKSVGIVANLEDPFISLVKNALKNKYLGIVREENYTFDTNDFRTLLIKLSSYDHIVLLGWEETGRIVKQARELKKETKFIGIDTFASENFRKNTNNNYEGLMFTFWEGSKKNQKYNKMITSYTSAFNKSPENVLFVTTGYDAMKILGASLDKCEDDVNCVNSKLKSINNFQGAAGKITIDQDNITRSIQESIHVYRNGEIIEMEK
jgi:branched-chain amino acid transport system substrate-binding protein